MKPKPATLSEEPFWLSEEDMARPRVQKPKVKLHRGSWTIRYRVDLPEIDENTGKQKRAFIREIVARAEEDGKKIGIRKAQEIADTHHVPKINQAHLRASSGHRFGDFIDKKFMPMVEEHHKRTTASMYRSILTRHIKPILGPVPLREITVARIQGLVDLKRKQGFSSQTVIHIRNVTSAALREAKRLGWLHGELPTESVRLPKKKHAQAWALSKEQILQLAGGLPPMLGTLVIFLSVTGLRIGEAMGLRWGRLHLDGDAFVEVAEQFELGDWEDSTKTRAGIRTVPLIDDWMIPVTERLRALRPEGVDPMAPVFASKRQLGKPINQNRAAEKFLRPVAKNLEITMPPRKAWHAFRVTYATWLDQTGLTPTQKMKLMGHSEVQQTTNYTKPEDRLIRSTMQPTQESKAIN